MLHIQQINDTELGVDARRHAPLWIDLGQRGLLALLGGSHTLRRVGETVVVVDRRGFLAEGFSRHIS